MAADVYLHIFEGIEERDLTDFFSNIIGSKYFDLLKYEREQGEKDNSYEKIVKTPRIWIGEVSWLKAALFEDRKRFIPSTVYAIQNIIGEDLHIIDDELIKKILNAFDLENETSI